MEQEIHFKEQVINPIEQKLSTTKQKLQKDMLYQQEIIDEIWYKDAILYTIRVQCKNCYRKRIANDGAKGEGIIMNFKGATLT